jgi:2-haloacid dehalogenase
MNTTPLESVTTLTFDIFGTVLDLAGSLIPPLDDLLQDCHADMDGATLWREWRHRQRIEQYQDNLLMLGHSGYLAVKRRALLYCLRNNHVNFSIEQVDIFMEAYQHLKPFDDAIEGLARLKKKYKLVMLSNGEEWYLKHLVENQIKIDPIVYRFAAQTLGCEPGQIMMVASHSFDVLGARASGYRGAYINRYHLPYDESDYQPDITVDNFYALCTALAV